MTVSIPILVDGALKRYNIVNLGRFQSENRIRKLNLPQQAVMNAAGMLHPFNDFDCLALNSYKVCPKTSIGTFSACLQSVFKGEISQQCAVTDIISPRTCISQPVGDLVAISMMGNGTVHYDLHKGGHLQKPDYISAFAILRRRETTRTLFCRQSQHRHITPELVLPAIGKEIQTTWEISNIRGYNANLSFFKPLPEQVDSLKNDLEKQLSLSKPQKL